MDDPNQSLERFRSYLRLLAEAHLGSSGCAGLMRRTLFSRPCWMLIKTGDVDAPTPSASRGFAVCWPVTLRTPPDMSVVRSATPAGCAHE